MSILLLLPLDITFSVLTEWIVKARTLGLLDLAVLNKQLRKSFLDMLSEMTIQDHHGDNRAVFISWLTLRSINLVELYVDKQFCRLTSQEQIISVKRLRSISLGEIKDISDTSALVSLINSCCALKVLQSEWCGLLEVIEPIVLSQLSNLRFRSHELSSVHLGKIMCHCHNLTEIKLDLRDIDVSVFDLGAEFLDYIANLSNLTSVLLSAPYTSLGQILNSCPKLKFIELISTLIYRVGPNKREITSIRWYGFEPIYYALPLKSYWTKISTHYVDSSVFQMIRNSQSCQTLQSLRIGLYEPPNPESVIDFVRECPSLVSLELNLNSVDFDFVDLFTAPNQIEVLSLQLVQLSGPTVQQILTFCVSLRECDLRIVIAEEGFVQYLSEWYRSKRKETEQRIYLQILTDEPYEFYNGNLKPGWY